jgi:hypothetical protein
MGKAQKKKKTQAWRHNPIRVPDSHLPAGKGEGSADPSKEKQTVPVLAKVRLPPIPLQAVFGGAGLIC